MRQIISLMHVSLDGYTAGLNGEMDWIVYNNEVAQISHSLHDRMDTAIYGRVTYEMMADYWSTALDNPQIDERDRKHALWLKTAGKIAVSNSLDSVTWENTRIIRGNLQEAFNALKQQSGKDMWVLGSPTLTQSMLKMGLIDELHININPVILGGGKPFLGELKSQINLQLIESKTLEGGVVTLKYQSVY